MIPAEASALLRAEQGDVLVIPVALIRALGGNLSAAVFLRQSAYLSAVTESNDGWFFLEQTGRGREEGKIFERLGSWEACTGLGPDAQVAARRLLKELGLLEESRKGLVHGKLKYRVQPARYLTFLASCDTTSGPVHKPQSGNPDCTNGEKQAAQTGNPDCTNGETPADVYQVDDKVDEKKQQQSISTAAATTAAPAPPGKSAPTSVAGVRCWTPDDRTIVDSAIRQHGEDEIKTLAERLAASLGRMPYPSELEDATAASRKAAAIVARATPAVPVGAAGSPPISRDKARLRAAQLKEKMKSGFGCR